MRRLIVICGMPRSGTTWLGKIFDSHPLTRYRHEPDGGGRLQSLPFFSENWTEIQEQSMQQFIFNLDKQVEIRSIGKFPIFRKLNESTPRFHMRKAFLIAAKTVSSFFGNFRIPEFLPNDPEQIIVWKSIESMGRMPLIAAATGQLGIDVYFIHIIRHPCGQLNSTLAGQENQSFTEDYHAAEDEGLYKLLAESAPGKQYQLTMGQFQKMSTEQRLTWRWALMNDFVLQAMAGQPNYIHVRYEDLCNNPELLTQQLFNFCNLRWNQQSAHFIEMSTQQDVPHYYSVIKNPILSANAWRKKLSAQQIETVTLVAEETLSGQLYWR